MGAGESRCESACQWQCCSRCGRPMASLPALPALPALPCPPLVHFRSSRDAHPQRPLLQVRLGLQQSSADLQPKSPSPTHCTAPGWVHGGLEAGGGSA